MEEDEKKDLPKEVETETTENKQEEQAAKKQEQKETKEPEDQQPKKQEEPKKQEKTEASKKKEEKTEKKEAEPKKKRKGPIVALILIVIAIAVAVGAFFIFKTTTIDLTECLSIEYDGYSGYAIANVTVDEKAIRKQIDDYGVAKDFAKKIEIEVENTENLSNGDEIAVKAKISSSFLEENKLKIKDKTVKITVSGLEEPLSIDMSKYIKIEYKGYNKHATANATLMTDKIEEDFGYDVYSKIRNQITLTVENNGTLENGNTVKVKVEVNNSYNLERNGIKLSTDTVEFKVEGLADATEVDAFKDITVDVTGMSPNLSISITNNSTDEFLKTVEYSVSKRTGVANGETVTITAESWDENLALEKALALKETTMEYTVTGQAAYIFSLSEINDTVKAELKSTFVSKATSKANENYTSWGNNAKYYLRNYSDYKYIEVDDIDRDLSVGTPKVVSMYLLTKKTDKNLSEINIITAIVKVPFKSSKAGVTYNWYITIQASNASLKTDGTVSENTNYSITAQNGEDEEKAYQAYVNDKKNNYNVEKISL